MITSVWREIMPGVWAGFPVTADGTIVVPDYLRAICETGPEYEFPGSEIDAADLGY